jgi:hypothetical protein
MQILKDCVTFLICAQRTQLPVLALAPKMTLMCFMTFQKISLFSNFQELPQDDSVAGGGDCPADFEDQI